MSHKFALSAITCAVTMSLLGQTVQAQEANETEKDVEVIVVSGTPAGALVFGGEDASTIITNTELYDGTSWAESNDLSVARKDHAGGSHSGNTASLAFGGKAPSTNFKDTAEHWTVAAVTNKATVS